MSSTLYIIYKGVDTMQTNIWMLLRESAHMFNEDRELGEEARYV